MYWIAKPLEESSANRGFWILLKRQSQYYPNPDSPH